MHVHKIDLRVRPSKMILELAANHSLSYNVLEKETENSFSSVLQQGRREKDALFCEGNFMWAGSLKFAQKLETI